MKKRISIVMTSYNGEKYIYRQLLSLLQQSRIPDEVLIFDDKSTDNTAFIIEKFINENHLDKWKLNINETNLGWKKNFFQGILKAQGDYIFLSDQDDVWDDNKINEMEKVLDANDRIEILACNIEPKYEDDSQPNINRYARKYGIARIERVKLCGKTFRPIRPGCSYAIKKSIISEFEKLWSDECAHDSMLWGIAIVKGTLYILNETLMIQYRHEGNNTLILDRNSVDQRIENIEFRARMADRYANNIEEINERNFIWLNRYQEVVHKRVSFMRSGNFLQFISLIRYMNYYPKLTSWLGDMYAYIKSN